MDYHGVNHPFVYTFISQQQVCLLLMVIELRVEIHPQSTGV